MLTQNILTFLMILPLICIVIEAFVLRKYHRSQLNYAEGLVNISLGVNNLVAGILFTGIHLFIYQYLYRHYSLSLPLPNPFLQLLVAFLLYDFLYYWSHWAHHRCNLLWANHWVHHSGQHFNFTTAVRLGFLGNFTVWIFFLPMAFLGIPLEHYLLVIAAQFIYQFFIHTTLVRELGWLEKILVTPSQHRVHHASNALYLDRNFGCFLVVWDRLFGTYQREIIDEPPQYGVTHSIEQPFSPGYLNCFLYLECLRQAWRQPSLRMALGILLGPPSRLQLTTLEQVLAVRNNAFLTSYLGLLAPLLISFYIVLNVTELSTADAWRVPLSLLLISCLYISKKTIRYRWSLLNSLLVKGLETGVILYLLTHYNNLQPILWFALVSIIVALLVKLFSFSIARSASNE
ncbi:Fatty acid hydroxylase superfamily [Serratia fonticola]|uniref:sterol desaturase family protein n=1 Tax=Serratia fonticola TaxID=47917 RepID=UPI000BA1F7FD|nr:sterol desaturase family protein [Serratia fonticola]PAA98610.1 hypothetical protein CJJ13_05810 [Serratia fonticola]CAI0807782.1 Fatty acid hydroxylase superfamily [Serratia fonticola]